MEWADDLEKRMDDLEQDQNGGTTLSPVRERTPDILGPITFLRTTDSHTFQKYWSDRW